MHTFKIQTAMAAGFSAALFAEQFGCASLHLTASAIDPAPMTISGQGRLIESFDDLKPDALPGKRAEMLMAGTHIPVDLSVRSADSEFVIVLHAHGETFETEKYRTTPTSFSLSEAGGDNYVPALDLLRFPMHLGDQWTWQGRVLSGGIQRQATATVSSSSTTLYQGGLTTEAVKVDVDLSLYSEGDKTPAARKLVFEFVPGKGIVRREFGDASVRQPPSE